MESREDPAIESQTIQHEESHIYSDFLDIESPAAPVVIIKVPSAATAPAAQPEIQHYPPSGLRCYLCPVATYLKNQAVLKKHFVTNHPAQEVYHCDDCDFSVRQVATYNDHLWRHDSWLHKCQVCPLRFPTEKTKTQHETTAHKAAEHTCPSCGKQFRFRSTMKMHESTEHGADEQECLLCGMTFPHLNKLKAHRKSWVHKLMMKAAFRCFLCDDTETFFSNKKDLEHHLASAHQSHQETYRCKDCNFSSPTIERLNHHSSTHVIAKAKILAKKSSASGVPEHKVDTGRKPRKIQRRCLVCNKRFNETIFAKHMKQHESSARGENTSRCYLCPTTAFFEDKTSLLQHVLFCHQQQQTHDCRECGELFHTSESYNRHLEGHDTSEPPYQCSEAGFEDLEAPIEEYPMDIGVKHEEYPIDIGETKLFDPDQSTGFVVTTVDAEDQSQDDEKHQEYPMDIGETKLFYPDQKIGSVITTVDAKDQSQDDDKHHSGVEDFETIIQSFAIKT